MRSLHSSLSSKYSRKIAVTREISSSKFRAFSYGTASTFASWKRNGRWTAGNGSESRACNYYNGRPARRYNLIWFILLNDDDDYDDANDDNEASCYSLVYGECYVIYRVACCCGAAFQREIGRSRRPLRSSITRGTCGGCALNIRDFTSSFSNPASALRPSHVS